MKKYIVGIVALCVFGSVSIAGPDTVGTQHRAEPSAQEGAASIGSRIKKHARSLGTTIAAQWNNKRRRRQILAGSLAVTLLALLRARATRNSSFDDLSPIDKTVAYIPRTLASGFGAYKDGERFFGPVRGSDYDNELAAANRTVRGAMVYI